MTLFDACATLTWNELNDMLDEFHVPFTYARMDQAIYGLVNWLVLQGQTDHAYSRIQQINELRNPRRECRQG